MDGAALDSTQRGGGNQLLFWRSRVKMSENTLNYDYDQVMYGFINNKHGFMANSQWPKTEEIEEQTPSTTRLRTSINPSGIDRLLSLFHRTDKGSLGLVFLL